MPSVNVYNQEGKVIEQLALNERHFGVNIQPGLVHQVLVAQQANVRQAVAHTKTKGEVRGGGKKPWKQKGTGRARQGSTRSPQWVGGGIVFGPRSERNFSVKVNRKVKQKALFMALSDKVKDDRFKVLNQFTPTLPKTKFAAELFQKLSVGRNVLVIIPSSNPSLMRMVRNLPHVTLVTINSIHLQDVLQHQTVLFWKDAITEFEKLYR